MCKEDVRISRKLVPVRYTITSGAGTIVDICPARSDRVRIVVSFRTINVAGAAMSIGIGPKNSDGNVHSLASLSPGQPSHTLTIDVEGPLITEALAVHNGTGVAFTVCCTEYYWGEELDRV